MSTTNTQELPTFTVELSDDVGSFYQRRAFVKAMWTTPQLTGAYRHFKQGPSTPTAGAKSLKDLMQTRRDDNMTVEMFLEGLTEEHHMEILFGNRCRREGEIDEINLGVTRTIGDRIEYALLDCPYTRENYLKISVLYYPLLIQYCLKGEKISIMWMILL